MSRFEPLRSVTASTLPRPSDFRFVEDLTWVPVADSEFYLTSHHLPLAIRFDRAKPQLGAVVGGALLARPTINATGAWQAAYQPMAVRCYPVRLVSEPSGNPLDDLEIDQAPVTDTKGAPITAPNGEASPEVRALHKSLRQLTQGQVRLSAALDRAVMADVVAPIAMPGENQSRLPALFSIDARAFEALSPRALATMVRQSYLPIEVMAALLFSQRRLRPGCLPRPLDDSRASGAAVHDDPALPHLDEILARTLDLSDLVPVAMPEKGENQPPARSEPLD